MTNEEKSIAFRYYRRELDYWEHKKCYELALEVHRMMDFTGLPLEVRAILGECSIVLERHGEEEVGA